MAWRGGALVDVDLAVCAGEASRAEALGAVVDGRAQTAVLADALGADHVHALVLASRPGREGLLRRVALEALALAWN